ncbi:MAG: rhomboid family intramembrane serine protease [Bacteroidia bacterium]|jgi:membrane associated rhomboid family serine protease|nr:rhomboid family intramembrane serine protease [Bacteroidia bacterium]
MSIVSDIKRGLSGVYSTVNRILLINVLVFLTVNITVNLLLLNGRDDLSEGVIRAIGLSGDPLKAVMFVWTFITYSFMHIDFWHILGNMLLFWFLGRLFSDHLGGARLWGTYLLGGIAGGILFIGVSMFMQGGDSFVLFGASAATTAVVVGIAAFTPESMVYPFGIPVKLKWFALISFLLSSLLELSANTGGKVSHIGGALLGFWYGSQLRLGKRPLESFMNWFAPRRERRSRSKLRVEHVQRPRGVSDEQYNQSKALIRRRIDEILDKISRSGYDSLSREEREFLQNNHDKT